MTFANKTDEIQPLIKNTQADVITIQETKLKSITQKYQTFLTSHLSEQIVLTNKKTF